MMGVKISDANIGRFWDQVMALEESLARLGRPTPEQSIGIKQALEELRQFAHQLMLDEQILENQNRILRSILDSISAGVIAADCNGHLLLFNPTAERILGIVPTDVPLEEWADRYGLYLCDQVTPYLPDKHPLARAVKGEAVDGVEIFVRHSRRPDGIWVSVTARPLKDETDVLRGGVIVFSDITERKRIENGQRDSEALYHSLVQSLPQNIFRKDRDGRFIFGNRNFCASIGRPLNEILGRTDFDFFPPELAEKYREHDTRVIETGEIFETVEEYRQPDGGTLYLQVIKTPIYDSRGAIVGTQGIYWDITARRQAEEALRKAHVQTEQWLAAIPSILISVDENDRVTQWNRMAEQVFGIPSAETIGRPFAHCAIVWDWSPVLECVGEAQKKSCPIRLADLRYRRPDGKEGFLGITVNPIQGDGDKPLGVLLLGADITERKILESQLTQAQKLESIGQLAAGIAHEINTPIQYVGDNMSFLRDAFASLTNLFNKYDQWLAAVKQGQDTALPLEEIAAAAETADLEYLREEIPKAIEQSLDGVDRVAKIVRAMKEFSHPATEQWTMLDLNHAIESTITVSRNEWKYVADLVTHLDATLPPILCLPGPITQVLLNLIVNAAHAIADVVDPESGNRGTITISTHRLDDWAEIRICDTGTGIPEAVRAKIFDPFFTTKEVGKGTGQGLAIAHAVVVKTHGGTITFETKIGEGTTFILRLPIGGVAAPS